MKLKKGAISVENGFLTQIIFYIFYYLERVSLFYWVRVWGIKSYQRKHPNSTEKPFVRQPIFPEIWLLGNVILAIVVERIAEYIKWDWLLWLIIIYSLARVFEMFVYQVNVLFFHRMTPVLVEEKEKKEDKKKSVVSTGDNAGTTSAEKYVLTSYTRTIISLIFNMFEYVLQFAAVFSAASSLLGEPSMRIGIMGSFEIFMNMVNPEEFFKTNVLSFAYVETIIGMFMNIICLARFVGLLPSVDEKGITMSSEEKNDKTRSS